MGEELSKVVYTREYKHDKIALGLDPMLTWLREYDMEPGTFSNVVFSRGASFWVRVSIKHLRLHSTIICSASIKYLAKIHI